MSQQVMLLFICDGSTNVDIYLKFPVQCISLNFQSSKTSKRARHINPFWIKTPARVPPLHVPGMSQHIPSLAMI